MGTPFPLFLPFFLQIISERHGVLRGLPAPLTVRQPKEQRDGPLFCAVFGATVSGLHRGLAHPNLRPKWCYNHNTTACVNNCQLSNSLASPLGPAWLVTLGSASTFA